MMCERRPARFGYSMCADGAGGETRLSGLVEILRNAARAERAARTTRTTPRGADEGGAPRRDEPRIKRAPDSDES